MSKVLSQRLIETGVSLSAGSNREIVLLLIIRKTSELSLTARTTIARLYKQYTRRRRDVRDFLEAGSKFRVLVQRNLGTAIEERWRREKNQKTLPEFVHIRSGPIDGFD